MKNRVVQLLFVFTIAAIMLIFLNKSIIPLSSLIGLLWPITLIGIAFIIFIENRSPQSTLAWFLVLTILPVIGLLLYLLFGRSRWRRKNTFISFRRKKKGIS